MKNVGLQGHHWWPKYLGGADADGLVLALSTPYAHTAGARSIHVQMNRFLGTKLGVSGTDRNAIATAFKNRSFSDRKAMLKEFYESQGLKMPDFTKPGEL